MNLALSYNVFDGTELLLFAIKQIRKHVDYISINYQEISYFGNKVDDQDLENIYDLLYTYKLVDHINLYKPRFIAKTPQEAKILEKEKRNIVREVCKNNFNIITHYMESDCDEFFKSEEFLNAKNNIIKYGIEYSAVKYYNYFNEPIFQEKKDLEISNNVVPFICVYEKDKQLGLGSFLGNSDPTRSYQIEHNRITKLFDPSVIVMHHMSGIRKNLSKKYTNTSYVNLDRNRINDLELEIKSINSNNLVIENKSKFNMLGNNYKLVDNYFGIEF